jgi:hypothetical protein
VVPRYYFHLYNDMIVCDDEGQEVADDEAARQVAIASARDMAAVSVRGGRLNLKHRIEVADEGGKILRVVRFEDVVKVEAQEPSVPSRCAERL